MKKSKRLFLPQINYDESLISAQMYFKSPDGEYNPAKLNELNDFITKTGKHIRNQRPNIETNL